MTRAHEVSARGIFSMYDKCPRCGEKLKRISIELPGKPVEVTCYGSCGCEESKWDGVDVPRSEREWARAGIPSRYLHAEADLGTMASSVSGGVSLYIHGPYGSGKTTYACALLKALVNSGVSARFENCRHLMTEIQGMFDGKKTDALDRAYACRVLVLDDLGKEQVTEYSISMLYELVDSRYAAGKPIVVTSNFTRGELVGRWAKADAATAESIASRLCDNVETVYMGGVDRRLA